MSTGSRVAGAVAAGYALGRFKKLRLAVLVATAMSSPKFRNAAFGLIENRIPGGAIVGTLSKEVGSKLLDAGKAAATSVVASRIDSLSENLAGRSKNMRGGAPNGQSRSRADEAADDRGSTEPEDETSDEEEPEAEYDEEETDEEEPEAKDAARVTDDGDSVDEEDEEPEDEEPVARSPRRRRSASPAGRRRG